MDFLGLASLVLSTSLAMLLVPDLHANDLVEPVVGATLVTPIILTTLVALRIEGARPTFERGLLALFLFFMPTVYLSSLALHGPVAPWVATEVGGQLLFAGLAVVGVRYSGWFLVAGLAGHGLAWDLWHHGRTPFMPDWYAVGCLVVDVGWALYAASRVSAWAAVAPAVDVGRSEIARVARSA